jgi:hypothetical protein
VLLLCVDVADATLEEVVDEYADAEDVLELLYTVLLVVDHMLDELDIFDGA